MERSLTPYHNDEFVHLDATAQAKLVRNGDIKAIELTEAAIARIEHLNPLVNALASHDFDLARERARTVPTGGVFAGVPTLIKDLTAYPGHTVSYGSRLFAGQRANEGSAYTASLDAAGLVTLGKSATSEFGLIGTTESLANGATRNPWDRTLSPGGSSGGAVAAVAAGMVPVAHASDGGGSIRGPSSFTGLFGFKPSRGRTVSNGMPPDLPTTRLISEHCVSRSVRDSYNWLLATQKPDIAAGLAPADIATLARPKRLKIGVYHRDSFGQSPSPEIETLTNKAAELCRHLGHEVREMDGPRMNADANGKAYFALTGFAINSLLAQVRNAMGPAFNPSLLEPYTLDLASRAQTLTHEDIVACTKVLEAATAAANDAIEGFDVLICPTIGFSAFPLGRHGPDHPPAEIDAMIARLASYTVVASLTGWPAMSVPLFMTNNGMPIGCHFAAAKDRDALLFSLALELEEANPWMPRLLDLQERLRWLNV